MTRQVEDYRGRQETLGAILQNKVQGKNIKPTENNKTRSEQEYKDKIQVKVQN